MLQSYFLYRKIKFIIIKKKIHRRIKEKNYNIQIDIGKELRN